MSPRKTIYPVFPAPRGMPVSVHLLRSAGGGIARPWQDRYPWNCQGSFEGLLRSGRNHRPSGRGCLLWRHIQRFAIASDQDILAAASIHVDREIFTGIRFSTRPDCLEDEVIELISKYPVRTVELGAQSLSDPVLRSSRRGYCVRSVYDAAKRVRDAGWDLGIQLMAGLPGDTHAIFVVSIQKAIEIAPDFLRIYPTLVLNGTALADLFRTGGYTPLSLDDAVSLGLHPLMRLLLRPAYLSSGWACMQTPHWKSRGLYWPDLTMPAFGHLVRSRWWRDRIDRGVCLI